MKVFKKCFTLHDVSKGEVIPRNESLILAATEKWESSEYNIFYFHPYLGKIPILTNIFQMGWNHQPAIADPDRRSWIRKSKCICQQRKSTLDLGPLAYREDTTQRVRHDKGMPRHESQRAVCSRPNCEIQYARGPSIHSTHHGVWRNFLMMCQDTKGNSCWDFCSISRNKNQHSSAWDPACCDRLLNCGEDVAEHGLRLPVLRAFVILNRVEDVNALMYDYRSLQKMDWMQGMEFDLCPWWMRYEHYS